MNDSGGQDIAARSMAVLGSLHAAMVNYHLYPPSSEIVQESVRRAREDLEAILGEGGSVTFCELEGKLLINDFCLDEKDQARPNTVSFLKDLAMWEARSITFEEGLSGEELRSFLEIFSRKRSERSLEKGLGALLLEEGVVHVKVDEKVYVSLSKDQDPSALSGSTAAGAIDLLRDEVFVRFLVGNIPAVEAPQEQVADLLSDPQRVNAAFQAVMLNFESSGGAVGPEKARLIRDTVDRMYGLVERLADEDLKRSLNEEMIEILAALEPETLVEVLCEEVPQAMKGPEVRREIISSVEGENVLKLTDQVVEKYLRLLEERKSMDPGDYQDISAVLNEIIADLYMESDPSYHADITGRLRASGLLSLLAEAHPQAGRDMAVYTIISDIRSSGSLRALEGLSDGEVVQVAGKLMDMGEEETALRIVAATTRNLESDRPDFRLRACRFLEEIHQDFRRRGHRAEIAEKAPFLLALLGRERDGEVKACLLSLLACLAGDLFQEGRNGEFARICETLLSLATGPGEEATAASAALSSMNPWDVGKPLAESLFGEDEELAGLAAKVLPFLEESLTVVDIVDRIKGEEEIKITPQLAEVGRSLGDPLLSALSEVLEANLREEVYARVLDLLGMMGGNAAVDVVKSVENNPIPGVRAHAMRTLARMSPGDPTLLSHFLRALRDQDPEVRREGARGLGSIDDPRAVEALLGIVQGKSPAGEEHPRVEEAACLALARLGPESAVTPLMDLLRKRVFALRKHTVHPRVKAAACYALGQIGGPEAAEIVRGYLEDPDPILRNEARKAVAAFRQRGFL